MKLAQFNQLKKQEEHLIDPTLSFDDPNRYGFKPKENNSDVPF